MKSIDLFVVWKQYGIVYQNEHWIEQKFTNCANCDENSFLLLDSLESDLHIKGGCIENWIHWNECVLEENIELCNHISAIALNIVVEEKRNNNK